MFTAHFVHILLEILPVFFIAVLSASLLEIYLPDNYFEKLNSRGHVGEQTSSSKQFSIISFSAFLGALIPICTCGMIPLAISLYRKKLDWQIILPFLLAGNACSIPALILTYGSLGLKVTLYRLAIATLFAILVTYFFIFTLKDKANGFINSKLATAPKETVAEHRNSSCCSHEHSSKANKETVAERTSSRLKHIIKDISLSIKQFLPWIFCSAAIASILHFNAEMLIKLNAYILNQYISPWILSLAAFPFYFCAGADIPISKELLDMGVPLGAILSFMTASPSINLTTLLVYKQALNWKASLFLTLSSLIAISVLGTIVQ